MGNHTKARKRPFLRLNTVKQRVPSVAILMGLVLHGAPALADIAAELVLEATVYRLERTQDARIGVLVRDTASDLDWAYREDERFLMASTFKSLLCGAVLDRVDQGSLSLDEAVAITARDILSYAPVTKAHVGGSLSIADLCLATLDMSDNTAANLLIQRLGGPQEVTAYLRRIGDPTTRLDRLEPFLNGFVPGDPRDTSSPVAMVTTWQAMLQASGLTPGSARQLADWMSLGSVTGDFIRRTAPRDWQVVDKSGDGQLYTRNLIAMITRPGQAPYYVAIFVSDTPADWATRNAMVSEISDAVVAVIESR